MSKAYLHIGSNEGNRTALINQALIMINTNIGEIKTKSKIYETEPWGKKDQNNFLNIAFEIKTILTLDDLLKECQKIEVALGKHKVEKWGPRLIDIDILFYNDAIIDLPHCKIPHSHMHERNFVLVPMLEIAGDLVHPILNKTIEELYDESKDSSEVWEYEEINA